MLTDEQIDSIVSEIYKDVRARLNTVRPCYFSNEPLILLPQTGWVSCWSETDGLVVELSKTKHKARVSIQFIQLGSHKPLTREHLKMFLRQICNNRKILKARSKEIACQHYAID